MMVFTKTFSTIIIMFNYLFNTYEAVTPPPKSSKDFKQEIYQEPNLETGIINLLGLDSLPGVSYVNKPPDQPFIPETQKDLIPETQEDFIPEETFEPQEYSSNNQLVNNIINTGRSFIGHKYTYGGTSPRSGFDCSGFLQYIYKQNGIKIPRDTSGIFKAGTEVSLSSAKPGDIICSKGSGPSGRHVQMISRVDPENNQIYVIEAKGAKWGIVEGPLTKKKSSIISVRRIINQNTSDPFLTNQDIKSPTSSNGKFTNKNDFIKALNAGYQKALSDKGLDPRYSFVLTAQAAMESGWGKHLAGNFNFGGVKISDKEAAAHPEKAHRALTTDWSKERGYFKHYQNFRNFSSIEDYCKFRVNLLSNSRYNAFNSVGSNNPYGFVFHILSKGYGSDYGGPKSRKYTALVMKNYNTVINTLKS